MTILRSIVTTNHYTNKSTFVIKLNTFANLTLVYTMKVLISCRKKFLVPKKSFLLFHIKLLQYTYLNLSNHSHKFLKGLNVLIIHRVSTTTVLLLTKFTKNVRIDLLLASKPKTWFLVGKLQKLVR